jgi:hypothetical protein
VSRSRRGFLSAVVSTAAMTGVSPAAPRPRLPPGRACRPAALAARPLAAEIGVVDLDPTPELGLRRLARGHRPH